MNEDFTPPIPPPEAKRKPIQLVAQIDSVGKYLVLCLCDDGTIWKLDGLYEGHPEWEPFPTPPLK